MANICKLCGEALPVLESNPSIDLRISCDSCHDKAVSYLYNSSSVDETDSSSQYISKGESMNLMNDNECEGRTTADRFYLNCKVEIKKLSYREHQSRGKEWNEQADVVLLIPDQTTEADQFLGAWLPVKYTEEELAKDSSLKNYTEFVMETGVPINGYFRGAVSWGNNLIPKPHIFVMTKKAEELIKLHKAKRLKLTVLGDGEEEALYELNVETKSPYADMK